MSKANWLQLEPVDSKYPIGSKLFISAESHFMEKSLGNQEKFYVNNEHVAAFSSNLQYKYSGVFNSLVEFKGPGVVIFTKYPQIMDKLYYLRVLCIAGWLLFFIVFLNLILVFRTKASFLDDEIQND